MHLRSGLLKKVQNAIKTWIPFKFHFPLQFYNRLIHQFWKNINTGISWLSTSSAEPALPKSCPCLSASNQPQALWGRGEREAELEVEGCQQGTSSTGPHHRATAYIPVELWWLTVPKFALSRKKTCKLPRTRLRQRSPEANAWLLLTLNQITHARGCLPGWTWPGQRCATFFQYHRTISFPLWKLRRSLILTQAIFSPIAFPKLFRQHPWLPKTCRSEPKSSAMLLWVPFSNR